MRMVSPDDMSQSRLWLFTEAGATSRTLNVLCRAMNVKSRQGGVFYPQIAPAGSFFIRRLRRRGVFYPQIAQIHADYGGLSCRCAAIHAAGVFFFIRRLRRRGVFYPQIAPAGSFFIRRFRRFTQIMAACLAAARQFTPPVFLPIKADSRRLLCLSRAGGEFFYPQISQIHADYGGLSCRCAAIHAAGFFAD
jgi:hypothetical protein